ncbi:MAG: Phytochrome, two-component sensor histidine kinase [Panacagrimonas sp.]|nr:ATP-binding protein [Panacagrimonas sp.]MCC2655502.1 Phytochrome, two-component sensor histidine kinase [Panacagrimonas sp.]
MSLKYSFAFAVLMATAVFGLGQLGLLTDMPGALPYVLAALVLVAAAGAWFVDLLDRRLDAMQQAVQKLAGGDDTIRIGAATRGAPEGLARPFTEMASAVNQRLSELQNVIAQQRAIAEHGPDAMWVFHVEAFQIIDANENFAKLTGNPRTKLIGMNPMQIAPPEQQGMSTEDYARALVQRAIAGEKLEVPWLVRHTDGREIPCELRAIHLPAPGRTLICGMLLDISERHRTLSELDRRMRFESLVTRLSTGFISVPVEEADESITDALAEVGRFAEVDRAYIFEFSGSREKVSCTHEWCERGIATQRDRLQDLPVESYAWCLSRIQRGEVVSIDRVSALPPDAEAERTEWEAESIRSILLVPMNTGSQVRGYVGFDAVEHEVQWAPQLTTLLKLFGEMVSNLLERKRSQLAVQANSENLGRANAELARSNQELQQFAYIASHDLQEPLRAIGGFSGLLARRYRNKLDAEAQEYLDFLTAAATRMQRMIVDLLDYSRLGHEPKPFQPVNLRDTLEAALALLQTAVQELGAEFLIGDLPTVQGDNQQLMQLFQNLVGNALKFHGEEPPSIMVSGRRSGNEWVISVRDNGIGIDPEKAADVFQIFRRLHSQEQYPGTGIGLAVCKRIVERHRGRIWAQPNEQGRGTTFAFALPAINENADPAEVPRWRDQGADKEGEPEFLFNELK